MMGATTLLTLLESATSDEFGDDADTGATIAKDIPGSIIEQRQTNRTRADTTPRTVRYYTGRVPAGTPVRPDIRVKDQRTGHIYMLENYLENSNPFGMPDIRLDLVRNT